MVGNMLIKEDPYYELIDMLVAPITCQHLKKAAEIFEYYGDIDIFKLGIPHQSGNGFELEYYTSRLVALKEKLGSITGNDIIDKKIKRAVELYNRMRESLREISLSRRSPATSLDSLDFIKLNHASFHADPDFMADILEEVRANLGQKPPDAETDGARLMLIGPNISNMDYNLIETVKDAGGHIVIEDIYEGIRQYRQDIGLEGDPLRSIAEYYLVGKEPPPAFMRYSTGRRLDFALEQIRYFNVSAVIWYELLCCETYDAEAYFFIKRMKEQKIPMLVLESDYGMLIDAGTRNRIEAFMEMIRGGDWND
jgi:benzoyl-CoA reductase/2-hydroxyglutaryl-CoA dehydratase subunit BcrC/BadD/HgdB